MQTKLPSFENIIKKYQATLFTQLEELDRINKINKELLQACRDLMRGNYDNKSLACLRAKKAIAKAEREGI